MPYLCWPAACCAIRIQHQTAPVAIPSLDPSSIAFENPSSDWELYDIQNTNTTVMATFITTFIPPFITSFQANSCTDNIGRFFQLFSNCWALAHSPDVTTNQTSIGCSRWALWDPSKLMTQLMDDIWYNHHSHYHRWRACHPSSEWSPSTASGSLTRSFRIEKESCLSHACILDPVFLSHQTCWSLDMIHRTIRLTVAPTGKRLRRGKRCAASKPRKFSEFSSAPPTTM